MTKKLQSEQIKETNGTYFHIKKYKDGSISSESITLEEYCELEVKFGGRTFYDY